MGYSRYDPNPPLNFFVGSSTHTFLYLCTYKILGGFAWYIDVIAVAVLLAPFNLLRLVGVWRLERLGASVHLYLS